MGFSVKEGLSQNLFLFTNKIEEVGSDFLVHHRHRAITTCNILIQKILNPLFLVA